MQYQEDTTSIKKRRKKKDQNNGEIKKKEKQKEIKAASMRSALCFMFFVLPSGRGCFCSLHTAALPCNYTLLSRER